MKKETTYCEKSCTWSFTVTGTTSSAGVLQMEVKPTARWIRKFIKQTKIFHSR